MSAQDFNFSQLAKYLKPGASQDLNKFLESLPDHVGKTALITVGVVWAVVAALGLYTMVQTKELASIKSELSEKAAIQPKIPNIKTSSVSNDALKKKVDTLKKVYPSLNFETKQNQVTLSGQELQTYGQFREALGHVANIDRRWVASIQTLCVGRECKGNKLNAVVALNTVSVQ